jgi:hypoxia up-regulated 1
LLAKKFNELPSRKGKKPLEQNRRAYLKLLKTANKFKEVLSANKDAPIHIEALADNEDFHSHVDRANFEEAILPLIPKLLVPI